MKIDTSSSATCNYSYEMIMIISRNQFPSGYGEWSLISLHYDISKDMTELLVDSLFAMKY